LKVHHATVSAFCERGGEEPLRQTLRRLLPEDAALEERAIEPETEGGVFLRGMVELRSRLTRAKDIRELAEKVIGGLDEYDRRRLKDGLPGFVDDDCNLYLRLSKEEAANGRMVLENRDPIHITFKLAAYPAKKENAMGAAGELVDGTPR
jgi:RNA binding exosome subunit